MCKNKPLTFTFHIGGKQVDTLTDEQLEKMSKRLGEAMSAYYIAHPEEYLKLKSKKTAAEHNIGSQSTKLQR